MLSRKQTKSHSLKKALFLDRDGVINIDRGYISTKEQCYFVNGIFQIIKQAKEKNYLVVVVTNQTGIGRGFYSEKTFHQFMQWINTKLDNNIDAYYFCPFHAEHGVGHYKQESFDRKPNPGMLLKAIEEHNIDPSASIMVGDKKSDMIAAIRAKIAKRFLLSEQKTEHPERWTNLRQLSDLKRYLL